MKISVVIVTYNNQETIKNCIVTINDYFFDYINEFVVIDNNSLDNTAKVVKSININKKIKLYIVDNLGFGNSNNIGFEFTKSEYVLLANPDIYFDDFCNNKQSIEKLFKIFEENENLSLIGIKLLSPNKQFQYPLYYKRSNFFIDIINTMGLHKITSLIPYFSTTYRYRDPNISGLVDIVSGAFMLFKSNHFRKIGGFNSNMFLYGEEKYIQNQLHKQNYLCYYFSEICAVHIGSYSIGKIQSAFSQYHFHKSHYLFLINKYHGFKILFRIIFIFGITIKYIYYILQNIRSRKKINEYFHYYLKLIMRK